MSILDHIKTTGAIAPRITIYGAPGIGKSSLANQFPDPLFLLTEQSGLVGIKAIQPPSTLAQMWENTKSLYELEKLPFKTLIVDSISKLDQLVIDHILAKEKPNKEGKKPSSLATACGGYGAGFQAAQQLHRGFKAILDKFQDRGVTVIYIGHLSTVKHKAPDLEDFDKYSIIMNSEKSREPYIDDVDCVLFCKLRSYLSETENGRTLIKSTEDRILITGVSDGHVSKNRFSMPAELAMSFNDISKYIPFYTGEDNEF